MEGEVMQAPDCADDVLSYISPTGYSYYAIATDLTPAFYKNLVDRCWRRSGTLLYRPNQRLACCPHYTLRLDAFECKPTKDQRQAVNRFNRYVLGDAYIKELARLHPRSREEVKKRDTVFNLVERIHEAELDVLPSGPAPAHTFTVTLETDEFTEEKYAVFENYQQVVHNEPSQRVSRTGFKRFLCNSPVQRTTVTTAEGYVRKLGSYHQCYRLDGKLVAIGVLDLLPDCVSAVYFLYHESIHKHSPGKLGALREIALAIEGGYRYWYSGYYIHTCPKMQYKNDYSPQFILDPQTLSWHHLGESEMRIFDNNGYARFSRLEQTSGGEKGLSADSKTPEADPRKDDEADANMDEDDSMYEFLLRSDMPGIPTLEEMVSLDMENLAIAVNGYDQLFKASNLAVWAKQSVLDFPALKSKIAELVAAIGPDLMDKFCVDFRRRQPS
ncbi:hypothetical protein PspLS_06031 [Pyricularia sp. CBS 133598]|nr:hypothetical protein PspLS_06031 [Pyricularia sp. CBS 133598]